jgi:hypothetical protein
MKSFCLAIACCAGLVGTAGAQPVPAPPGAQNVPALSDAQKTAIASLRSESEKKATLIAVQLAAVVQKIYDNNLADSPNETARVSLDNEMKELVWQLLLTKGDTMWAAFRLLTPEQKRIVKAEIAQPRAPGDLPDVMDLIVKTFGLK